MISSNENETSINELTAPRIDTAVFTQPSIDVGESDPDALVFAPFVQEAIEPSQVDLRADPHVVANSETHEKNDSVLYEGSVHDVPSSAPTAKEVRGIKTATTLQENIPTDGSFLDAKDNTVLPVLVETGSKQEEHTPTTPMFFGESIHTLGSPAPLEVSVVPISGEDGKKAHGEEKSEDQVEVVEKQSKDDSLEILADVQKSDGSMPNSGELFVRTKDAAVTDEIRVIQVENTVILSAQKKAAEDDNSNSDTTEPSPIQTVGELRKALEFIATVLPQRQSSEELHGENTMSVEEQGVSEIAIVVSDELLDLIEALTDTFDVSEKEPDDEKVNNALAIVFTTEGENKRQLIVDEKKAAQIQELFFVLYPDAKQNGDTTKDTDLFIKDQFTDTLGALIQEIEAQLQETSEPTLYVSEDVMSVITFEKTTIVLLEKWKTTDSHTRNETKEGMTTQRVILFSTDTEITIGVDTLKKLLLLRKVKKQFDTAFVFNENEQAPEEIKENDFSNQSGNAVSNINYLTILIVLSLLDEQISYNNGVGQDIYNYQNPIAA